SRRPGRVLHDPPTGAAGPEAVPPRDGGADPGRPRRRGRLWGTARSLGRRAPQPTGRSRDPRRVLGRVRLANLLDRPHRSLRLLLPAGVGARPGTTGQPPDLASACHRLLAGG